MILVKWSRSRKRRGGCWRKAKVVQVSRKREAGGDITNDDKSGGRGKGLEVAGAAIRRGTRNNNKYG